MMSKRSLFLLIIAMGVFKSYGWARDKPDIKFVSNPKIVGNEKMDTYFNNLSTEEIKKIDGLSTLSNTFYQEAQKEHRKRYKENVLIFTEQEENIIRSTITDFQTIFISSFSVLSDFKWRFVKVKDVVLFAEAHTLDGYIFLTTSSLSLSQTDPNRFKYILIEEAIHILQRQHPKFFEPIYYDWGFQKVDKIEGLESLPIMHNPDCEQCLWVYRDTGTFIYTTVLYDENKMVFFNLEETSSGTICVKDNPTELSSSSAPIYCNKFLGIDGKFDPNEVYANLFAQIFIMDNYKFYYGDRDCYNSEIYKQYREFFKNQLSAKIQ